MVFIWLVFCVPAVHPLCIGYQCSNALNDDDNDDSNNDNVDDSNNNDDNDNKNKK